jgi:Outer membrane protein beta-barrel domain
MKKSVFIIQLIISIMVFTQGAFAQDKGLAVIDGEEESNTKDGSTLSNVNSSHKYFGEISLGVGSCIQGEQCEDIGANIGFGISGFYFVYPNIAAGLSFSYQSFNPEMVDSSTATSFGVEGRYFFPIKPKLKGFGLAGSGLVGETTSISGQSNNHEAIYIQFGGGVDYFFAPNMSIGGILKFQYNIWMDDDSGNGIDANYLFLGGKFNYYF